MKKYLLLISVFFIFTSCTLYRVESVDIGNNYHASKETISDVIFLENVTRPHEVIGQVIVNAERRQKISEVMEKMRREAAILGGDAITDIKSDASGTWKNLPGQELIGNAYVRSNFSASVVAFK